MKYFRPALCLFLSAAMLLALGCERPAPAPPAETQEALYYPFDESGGMRLEGRDAEGALGAVSSANYYASRVGADILQAGGNAIDAAVAVAFAIGTVESYYSGLGGGGFMTIRFGDSGESTFIDFRETAPAAATPELWPKDADGAYVSVYGMVGGPSIAVPGQVKGLLYALEKYGSLSREAVIAPSIALAEEGFPVGVFMRERLIDAYSLYTYTEETAGIYFKDGLPYDVGELYRNPALGDTLRRIAREGAAGFYAGEVAEAIVSTAGAYGSPMSLEDLAGYTVVEKPCLSGSYRGYEIITAPLPGGGPALIEALNILENFDVGAMELNSAAYIHLFAETFKLMFADREAYMGDSQAAPLAALTDKAYAGAQGERIDPLAAQSYGAGDLYVSYSGNTSHFSIMDGAGNMVSVTQTNNGGSGITARGTGVLLNNEMADFAPGWEGMNAIEGGKRPLSSMCPTLVLKDGEPLLALGSPGSTRILSTVVQVLSHVLDHGMDIQEAINAPRFYDGGTGELRVECRIGGDTVQALEAMGHRVVQGRDYDSYFGGVNAVLRLPDGSFRGGADPRRDGKALGIGG